LNTISSEEKVKWWEVRKSFEAILLPSAGFVGCRFYFAFDSGRV
jgi:hypothetical protein